MIKWPNILLVNKRGGVITVPKPKAEALLRRRTHLNAPDGAKAGDYLPEFDSSNELTPVKEPVKNEVKAPKRTNFKRKSASSKKSK